MILILVLVMATFFGLGYYASRAFISDSGDEILYQKKKLDEARREHEEKVKQETQFLTRKQAELEGTIRNYNAQIKETQVNNTEIEKLKKVIELAKKNCRCGVLSNETRI